MRAGFDETHITVVDGSFDEAVFAARANAQAGGAVLLSPACASFDQFRNFEQRGEAFKSLVAALAE